jgi:hypothetical protein
MGNWKEALKKLYKPKEGEVYLVPDEVVIMDGKPRKMKGKRPMLVISLEKNDSNAINVIPLSSSGKIDRIRFPIKECLRDLKEDCNQHRKSFALLTFQQPITKNVIIGFCGLIEGNCFAAVKRSIDIYLNNEQDDIDIDI